MTGSCSLELATVERQDHKPSADPASRQTPGRERGTPAYPGLEHVSPSGGITKIF